MDGIVLADKPSGITSHDLVVQSVTKGVSGSATYYFKVSDQHATQLAFASDNGKLWLALRPSANARTTPPSVVTAETLMLGVKPQLVYRALGGH